MTRLLIALLLTAVPTPADAPRVSPELTPTAHEARVNELDCKKNLADCEKRTEDRVEGKWLVVVAIVAGVACAGIGFGAGYAMGQKR